MPKDAENSVNEPSTGGKIDTPLTQPRSRRVRYEIIRRDGYICKAKFTRAQAAADYARQAWPDQEQDEDRTGKGWDVQVVVS